MKSLSVKTLTVEAFRDYGVFGNMTPPATTPLVGGDTISFWPDCGGVLSLGPAGNNEVALGVCQVRWRAPRVDVSEFHTSTGEGNLPLDGDVIIHVGRPTGDDNMPAEVELFYVPKGTMVVMKPGVWHHAPFAVKPGQTVNVLILLPQRTYANDCVVREPAEGIGFKVT